MARTQNNVTTADYWSAGIPTGTDTSAYQLFSIPFKTNKGLNAVTEVLGPPDEFKYRLYSYHNGFEEFTETNSIDMSLGNSYFFIWDKDQYPDILQLNFDFGKGESTPPLHHPLKFLLQLASGSFLEILTISLWIFSMFERKVIFQ